MSSSGAGAGASGAGGAAGSAGAGAGAGGQPHPPQWGGRTWHYYEQGPPGYYFRAGGGGGKKLVIGLLLGGIVGYAWGSRHNWDRDWRERCRCLRHPAGPHPQEGGHPGACAATGAAVPSAPATQEQPQPPKRGWGW